MSPYLENQPRSQARVLHDQLLRGDFWMIVELTSRGPEPVQDRYWHSFADCVRDIATGCDGRRALAVTCVNFKDGTSEIIDHDKLVALVFEYIAGRCDHPDKVWDCAFLDAHMPEWLEALERERASERQYEDDKRFYARAGT